jgi:hypothetical protein
MWHSCGNYALDDHFVGKDLIVREIFDRYVKVVRQFGPVTVYAQKSRIVFQARTRFAGAMTRKRWLQGQLWLKRRAAHLRIHRIEMYTYRDFGHSFRLTRREDLDEELIALLHEAYVMGS